MKRFTLFMVFLLFSGILFAQQNRINVVISIKCTNAPQFSIWNDTIREGQKYAFQAKNLPAPYNVAQSLYNTLVGSYILFEDGCINEDIQVRITLNGVNCSNGLFNPANLANLFFNWRIEVYSFNGLDPLGSPFNFTSPNRFRLVLLRSPQFNQFLTLSGINPAAVLAFAYMTGTNSFDLTGITTELYPDSIRVRASHFSDIVGSTQGSVTSAKDIIAEIPSAYALDQNYPNPFNPSTKIRYSLPERADVLIRVFDVMGVEVAKIVNETKDAGVYEASFDASGLPSGMYAYELRAGNTVISKKMLLLK
ncbi:hypothetical protein MASR1M107_00560 [Ignavibacteriales bacterium]